MKVLKQKWKALENIMALRYEFDEDIIGHGFKVQLQVLIELFETFLKFFYKINKVHYWFFSI